MFYYSASYNVLNSLTVAHVNANKSMQNSYDRFVILGTSNPLAEISVS